MNGPSCGRAKTARAKLDRRWRLKIFGAIKQSWSVETANTQREAVDFIATVATYGSQMLGSDQTALILYEMARILATPG